MDYLSLNTGQQFEVKGVTFGGASIVVQVPTGGDFLHFLARETYNMSMRRQQSSLDGSDPSSDEPDSYDAQANKKLIERVVVKPEGFQYTQIGGWLWNSKLQPILRRIGGIDRVTQPLDPEELGNIPPGEDYDRQIGPFLVRMTMPDALVSDRIRSKAPGSADDIQGLEKEWADFINAMIRHANVRIVEPEDGDVTRWKEWSAPRVAALYDVLVEFCGLWSGASSFRVEDSLQPLGEASEAGPDVSDGESDVVDDPAGDDHAKSEGDEPDSDDDGVASEERDHRNGRRGRGRPSEPLEFERTD